MTHPGAPGSHPEQGGFPPIPPPVGQPEHGVVQTQPPFGPYNDPSNPENVQRQFFPPPEPPKKRPWVARHKVLTALGALVLLGGIGSAIGGSNTPTTTSASSASAPAPTMPPIPPEQAAANSAASNAPAAPPAPPAHDSTTTVAVPPTKAPAPPKPAPPAAPDLTVSQENAVAKAEDYLSFTAFSRSGLIEQLVFDQFSKADATFAVDHITVNWKEQAAKKGQDYLDLMSFSRGGLISQLRFDGFTRAEATYAVDKLGL